MEGRRTAAGSAPALSAFADDSEFSETVAYMLDHGIKLEQEAVDIFKEHAAI